MRIAREISNVDRRGFLKSFPRQLINGVRSLSFWCEDKSPEVESEPKVARLDVTRCLAWGGANCQICYLACHLRDRALEMRDQKPVIIPYACDGCAMCVVACKTVNDPPALGIISRKQAPSLTSYP